MSNLVVMNKTGAHIELSEYLNLKEQGLQRKMFEKRRNM